MSTPNCYLMLWKNSDYYPPRITFDGPINVSDLHDKHYDGESGVFEQVDDSASSLQVGGQGWCVLFSKSKYDYAYDILKAGPGTNLPDLEKAYGNMGLEMGDTIASFKLFDTAPNFFDLDNPSKAAQTWLKTYVNPSFAETNPGPPGSILNSERPANNFIYGAGKIENDALLNRQKYEDYDGGLVNWYFYATSLKTGPSTWVELYTGQDSYTGNVYRFGPNSFIPDITLYTGGTTIFQSVIVYNAEPSGWPGTTEQIPTMVLRMQQYATASKLEGLASDMISMIPEVGASLSALLDILWPAGPGSVEVWQDLENYMEALVGTLIDQSALNDLNSKLEGLANQITEYLEFADGQEKANTLNSIILNVLDEEPYFLGSTTNQASNNLPTDPEQYLTYQVAFCSMALALLWERFYNYPTLSGTGTDPNKSAHESDLNDKAQLYTDTVEKSVDNAAQWRANQIVVKGSDGSAYVYDNVNGFIYGQDLSTAAANSKADTLRTQVSNQYKQELSLYILPASLWPYLETTNTDMPKSITCPYPVPIGTSNTAYTGTTVSLNGRTLTGFKLFSADNGSMVLGIQFFLDGVGTDVYGHTSSTSFTVTLKEDESLIGAFGRTGDGIDQLSFLTDAGREAGMGGPGGDPFYQVTPQGVDATLASIDVEYSSSYLISNRQN